MNVRRNSLPRMAAAAAVLVLAGCNGGEAPPADGAAAPADTPAMGAMDHGMGHDMGGMHMDPAMMERHARELDEVTDRMVAHVAEMRGMSPEQWHARMGEHVREVSRMHALMDRQMREMDMGMGMDDEHMGAMMGMSAEEHRRMMDEMRTIRAELEQLQTASEAEVRERMPAHLDRVERMVPMMERAAAHMREA